MKKQKLIKTLETIFEKTITTMEFLGDTAERKIQDSNIKSSGRLVPSGKVLSYFNKGVRMGELATTSHDANLHTLIYGATGSGKSSQIYLNNLLCKTNASFVVRDLDGSFEKLSSGFNHAIGADIKVINLKNAAISTDAKNILAGKLSKADIARISKLIISTNFKEHSYWTLSAEDAGANFIGLMKLTLSPEEQNIYTLKVLVEKYIADSSSLNPLVAMCKDKDVLRGFEALAATPEKARQSTLSTLKSCLTRIDEQIALITSMSTFEWKDLRKRRTIVYIQSDVLDDEYLNMVQSLLFTDLLKSLMSELPQEGDLPVRIFLDECSSLSLGKILETSFLNLRKYNTSLICAFQGPDSLRSTYTERMANVIEANAYTKVYLKGMSHKTAKYLEDYIGYHEVEDKKGRIKKEPVLSAHEIRTLESQAVLLTGNKPASLVTLKPYYKIYRMKKRAKMIAPKLTSLLDKLPNGGELQTADLDELKRKLEEQFKNFNI